MNLPTCILLTCATQVGKRIKVGRRRRPIRRLTYSMNLSTCILLTCATQVGKRIKVGRRRRRKG